MIIERKGTVTCSIGHVEKLLYATKRGEGPLILEVLGLNSRNKLTQEAFGARPMKYAQALVRMRKRLQDVGLTLEEAMLFSTHSMRRTENTVDKSLGVIKGERGTEGQWHSQKGMKPYEDEKAAIEMGQERCGKRMQQLHDLDADLIRCH